MFSSRTAFDLAPNRLAVVVARLRRGREPLLDLTEANPTRAGIPYDRRIAGALASARSLRYEPEPFGLREAREAVARALSASATAIDPSRIVLTASTSEAYAYLFKLLADPGDEVLVPRPSYPLFDHLARLECVVPVPYRLEYDGAWRIDIDSVRAAISPRTRAIVVVAPNNPTGSFLARGERSALASTGLPLVSDEVFASYPLRADRAGTRVVTTLPADDGPGPLVFALSGLSKLAGLPQMKLGWIAVGGPKAAAEAALGRLEVIADAFLSVGTPVQNAVGELLALRGPTERAILERARGNLARVRASLEGSGASVLDVEGGWSAILRLPATRTEEDWAVTLAERDKVYVHPGHFFDFESEAYVVVSLLTEPTAFAEGIARLTARVALESV